MSEMIWYLLIGLLSSGLCYALWLPQQRQGKKNWLLKQIQTSQGDKQPLLDALDKLNNQPPTKHAGLLLLLLTITPLTLTVQAIWFDNQSVVSNSNTEQTQTDQNAQAPDLATAIKQLEQKLNENPDDIQGQLLYAQSMVAMKRYDVAAKAYEKANQLQPNDAALLTEWAETIAFKNNTGSFSGQPTDLLTQAINLNPKHQKAMWLYGIVLFEQKEFAQAEAMWSDLLTMVDSPNIQNTLLKQINQAREAQGKTTLNKVADDVNPAQKDTIETNTQILYTATVDIDNQNIDLPKRATLFVFAKATDGMPMPIAAQKISGPFDWPINIQLNDAHSLQPQRFLSDFESVTLSALISYTGSVDDKQWLSEIVTTNKHNNINLILKRKSQ